MTARADRYTAALDRASEHARTWLAALPDRKVAPRATADELRSVLGETIPDGPQDPAGVIDALAAAVEPGLMSMGSGRFFGWVIGGTLPAALAADWLVGAWDQNAGMRPASPGVVAAEEAAARWLLDLLGLPAGAELGFVTGGTMANFSCLAAARDRVLGQAGWDVAAHGLAGAPPLRVIVGEQRHVSVDLALRYLGLGAPIAAASDDQGRIDVDSLEARLADGDGPAIVCLQAGNIHSGAFDDFAAATAVAHRRGAWVHIDGAFGLWAGAAPELRNRVAGYAEADSWATDAHKTLNVPYDCGIAIVADPAAMRASLGVQASYLFRDDAGDPLDRTPEMSRRARGVPVWAALQSLGREGVADLVTGLAGHARALADGLGALPGVRILNDVVFTQVSLTIGDDERTRAVATHLAGAGDTWMSGSRWAGHDVIRVSVSNWSTDAQDVAESVAAVARAIAATGDDPS